MAIFEVNPNELIIKTAEKLKDIEQIQPPEWAKFVKTSHGRDRPPVQADWWYIRSASILRKMLTRGPIGVNKLRVLYGNRKNYGMAPEHFVRASGNIIRTILQQLEKAGLAKQIEKEGRKGRIALPKGISLLDKTAAEIIKENPPKKLEVPKVPVKKEEMKEKTTETKKEEKVTEKKESKKEDKKKETKKEEKKTEEKVKEIKKEGEKKEVKIEKPKETKKEEKVKEEPKVEEKKIEEKPKETEEKKEEKTEVKEESKSEKKPEENES